MDRWLVFKHRQFLSPFIRRLAKTQAFNHCTVTITATASDYVSKKTDFVVTGEDAGSKLDKAQKPGVKIIGKAEFLKMVLPWLKTD